MFSVYGDVLRLPGVRRFVAGSVLSRLGGAMFGVSVVAMVSSRTGSYTLAGAISATGVIFLAVTAAILGRLIDRFGQRRVTFPLTLWSVSWSAIAAACSFFGAPIWLLFVTYALSAVVANTGTMSRARWAYLLREDPAKLHTAMSLEQVIDELAFVVGPVVGLILATRLFPEAGLIAAFTLYFLGTVVFLSARWSEPPVHPGSHEGAALAIRQPSLIILALVMFMVGTMFGGNEVVTIAVSEALGNKGASGFILALFAAASAVAGLTFGARRLRMPLGRALIFGTAGMFLLELPILFVDGFAGITLVLLIAGAATAPTLIITTQLSQRQVPGSQVNEAMNIVLTGILVGVAAGSAASGAVAERWSAHTGYAVPVAAAGLSFLLAVLGRRLLRERPVPAAS